MSDRTPAWLRAGCLLLLALTVPGVAGLPARADESKKDTPAVADRPGSDVKKGSALAKVPEDVAFFADLLRNKEQLDILLNSKAYKAFRKLPPVEAAFKQARAGLQKEDGPLEKIKALTEKKENKELLDLVLAGLHDEAFVYAGKGWTDLITVFTKIYAAVYRSLSDNGPTLLLDQKPLIRDALLEAKKNREMLQTPDLVFGVKLKDPKKVEAHIKRLEKPLARMLDDVEQLKGKLKLKGSFLTLQIDGSLISWDDIPIADYEDNKGEFDDLVKHLKKATLALSLGVKDGYLLFGLNSSLDALEKFGGKGKALAGRKEFEVLGPAATKKVTSIVYLSKEHRAALAPSFRPSPESIKSIKPLLEKLDLKEERKKAILKDIDDLADSLKGGQSETGSLLFFSTLEQTGYDASLYDFSRYDSLKGVNDKLVNHLGGTPIFAATFGFNIDGSTYAWLSKWVKKAYEHGEAIFLEMADDDAKDAYKKNSKEFLPLIKQLDEATRKLLLPSLKESGLGIVLDGKWTSKQWHTNQPKAEKALPMLEVGLLVGTTDGKKFASAMKEYRTTLNELYEKFRSIEGLPLDKENLPEVKLTAPDTEKGKNGTLYSWKLPEGSGLDKQFVPTAGTGKDVAVLTLSKAHTERLLASTKLQVKGLPARGNVVGVMVLDFPALVDLIMPWVEHGLNTFVGAGPGGDNEEVVKKLKAMTAMWTKQANEAARIARCFQGINCASYLDNGKLVTRTRILFKDLPEKPAVPEPKD